MARKTPCAASWPIIRLIKWVHEEEQAKASFDRRTRPPMLSVLLSTLGIYGKEILGPPPRAATDRVTSDKKEETS
jgi:hypothetical protein